MTGSVMDSWRMSIVTLSRWSSDGAVNRVSREVVTAVYYDGVQVARYRMDFVVDDVVVLEVKSTERLNPNDRRQLLNYLRATSFTVGLLFHFGPKPNFYRLVSTTDPRRG